MAVCRPRATSYELTCSQSSSLIAQNSREKIKFYKQKSIVGTGSGCEQALGHELWFYMLTIKLIDSSKYIWKNKINNENTTAGTGNGCEQAHGHQLW
jgi:hypothetical protein